MAPPTLPALLRALRQDPTTASALDQAADRLIATDSLADAQLLVFALQQSAAPAASVLQRLQQAAAICSEPYAKAEFLGFVLLQSVFDSPEDGRAPLLKVYDANRGVLTGFVAALTSRNGPFMGAAATVREAERALMLVAPVIKTVLIGDAEEGHKAAVLEAVDRVAWQFDEEQELLIVRTAVVGLLVEALELVPHSQLQQATYAVHVALTVDLLASLDARSEELVKLAARTARFLLETAQILLAKDVGVVALLQSLEQLAEALPKALWDSTFLTSCAYFLADKCTTPWEQQFILRVLTHTLEFGRSDAMRKSGDRSVFVEILVLPLAYLIAAHGSVVSDLLQLLTGIKAMGKFHSQIQDQNDTAPTETTIHSRSVVRLIGHERSCQEWLNSLFPVKEESSTGSGARKGGGSADKWLALVLVALLSDERPSLRGCAAKCLERQVQNIPKFWSSEATKTLVASLVFLVSQRPVGIAKATATRRFAEWMASCLYSLAALATATTDTMRIVLRLIDSMNSTPTMRSMALKLMFEVWRNESRVFPRLESMLLKPTETDQDVEYHVVKMATIKALCEKDAELGVQFISTIQGFLEDELETVVAMAMDAITALCAGDCLDFYVAFKIIAQKMRKNKITCSDEPLFQERLCFFYGLGDAESAANEKHASKLLTQTWDLADSKIPSVRKTAYFVMSKFPLDMLWLAMPTTDGTGKNSDDDDDEVTEEDIEEQIDDLMQRLQSEQDADVRVEIENLAARVIEHESTKLTAGVGRGQRMASAVPGWSDKRQSQQLGSVPAVSAAATKEMRSLLPSRPEVQALYPPASSTTTDWSGFLVAYRPKAVLDVQNVKRKDKLVRLATQNLDEITDTVTTVLQHMKLPWAGEVSADVDANCTVFLRIQTLMEGWRGVMATYVAALEELASLKTPVGVDDADVALRVFSEGVGDLTNCLLHDNPNKHGGALAAGALAGQLCESRHWHNPQLRVKYEETIDELSRQLALSMEEARVYERDSQVSCINASIALQLSFGRRKVDASESCSGFVRQLQKVEEMLEKLSRNTTDDLLRACAVLGISHIANLYTSGDGLETFEVLEWRQQRTKPLAGITFNILLGGDSDQNHKFVEDVMFPVRRSTKANTPVEKVVAACSHSMPLCASRWASVMGLARLATGFPAIRRLDWLANMRFVLSSVWLAKSSSMVAVALGSVLLQCVQFSLSSSLVLERFINTCIERAAARDAKKIDTGFLVMAATHVLSRLESLGGFPSTVQNQTQLLVEQITATTEDDSARFYAGHALAIAGVANFFSLGLGITGSFVPISNLNKKGGMELALQKDTVAVLVKVLRAESTEDEAHRQISSAVLGAIASSADGFYVSQKKKSFDVEIRALPPKGFLAKALEWLRQASSSGDYVNSPKNEVTAATRTATSLLACLTATGSFLPLLDYASLTHRVIVRLCSVDISVASVRFAVTQGSCDELLASELFSVEWFGNANTVVQAEMISGLSIAASRLPTDTLRELLTTTFGALRDMWRRDVSSSMSVLLFDSWTNMLHDILDQTPAQRIPEDSLEMVNQLILGTFVSGLPFGLDASVFVQQFAKRILSKVDYGESGIAGMFLMHTTSVTSDYSSWGWWRNTVFVIELVRLNVLVITKREASLIFQWILRHDFNEWTDDKDAADYLYSLIAQVGALVAENTRPGENVSGLLDVIDIFNRLISPADASVPSGVVKRRALFDVLACVLTWNISLSHEKYLLETASSATSGIYAANELLPFGLVAAQNAKNVSTLAESLWALLEQISRENVSTIGSDETAAFIKTLEVGSRQMYLAADRWQMPTLMQSAVRHFWSIGVTQ